MKRTILFLMITGMMLFVSCGKELPDAAKDYQVNKSNEHQQDPTPIYDGIPEEGDNTLPTY